MKDFVGLKGHHYSIDDTPLAAGGEATIYRIRENYNYLAKIYKYGRNTLILEEKIKYMVDNSPQRHGELAWPVDLLYSESHLFVGFVMNFAESDSNLRDLCIPENRYKYGWDFLLRVARNLSALVYNIHELGHCIGDFNPENILVDIHNSKVTVVDTDSFHIRNQKTGKYYPCLVAKPEFVAPELLDVTFSEVAPENSFSHETDNYSLSVIIFKLLIGGASPFACTYGSERDSVDYSEGNNIKNGVSVYFPETYNAGIRIGIPKYSPGIDWIPDDLKELFRRAFITGHKNPSIRPIPEEWYECLKNIEKVLTKCLRNKKHIYPNSSPKCPWCNLAKKISLFEDGNVILQIPKDHFTLVYKVDNVQIGPVEFYKEGDVVFLRPKHSEPDCYITPWIRDERETVSFLMPNHNVELLATSFYDKYSVSYYVGDEQIGEIEEYYVNEPVKLRARYYRTGFKVSEWKGDIPAFGKFRMPAHNIKMEATITAAPISTCIMKDPPRKTTNYNNLHLGEFSITYMVGEKHYGKPEYWKPGNFVTLRSTPSVLGKRFSPWLLNGKEVKEFVMPPRNLVLKTKEIPKSSIDEILSEIHAEPDKNNIKTVLPKDSNSNQPKYTVKYIVNNRQIGYLESYSPNTNVHLRPRFTKPGYTVTPWMMNGKLAKNFLMPNNNVVISATTNEKKYMIEYEVDGEIGDLPISLRYPGERLSLKDLPKVPGRIVTSWRFNGKEITDYFEMPSKNVVLEAKTKKLTC